MSLPAPVTKSHTHTVMLRATPPPGPFIFTLSARNPRALKAYAGKIVSFLEKETPGQEKQAPPMERIEKDLAGVASKILGIEEGEIEPDVNLHEYGFDPVLLAEFANRIGEKYRLEADLALPMEAPTLAGTNEGLEPQETFGQETRDSHHRPPARRPRPTPPSPRLRMWMAPMGR